MKPRAILFDKDGTLIKLFETWMPAYRIAAEDLEARAGAPGLALRLLEATGYDAAANRLRPGSPLSCSSNDEIIALWRLHPEVEALGEVGPRVHALFYEQAVYGAVPVTDLVALFQRLRAAGLKIGVATMDGTRAANASLERLGVRAMVDFVAGFDAGFGAKPDPGQALAFGEAIGVPMHQIAMVGDAVKDLQMGRAAGAGWCVGVLTGAAGRDSLEPFADAVIDSVAQLGELWALQPLSLGDTEG
jgi:phosphoglycolate phosphatase